MATTPVWVPLVVAILGLGGVLISQVLAGRREDARWQRERAREQDRWDREDSARSYEHSRAAYVAFFTEYNERWNAIALAQMQIGPGSEPLEDYLNGLYDLASQVEVFGTREAGKAARDAYRVLYDWAYRGKEIPTDVLHPFQEQIRLDLGIPE